LARRSRWTRLLPFGLIDRWLAPAPPAQRVAWLAGTQFAHRGLHDAMLPENSPSAFAAAQARGMGIECDIQLSRDGEALVFHDEDLDRLTAQSGPIAARSTAEATAIPLNGSSDTIPTLRHLLDQVAGAVPLLIEVKVEGFAPVGPICTAVQRALDGYRGPHSVMSFDPRVSLWFARHAPATPRGLVMTEEGDRGWIGRLRRHVWLWTARPDFLAYDIQNLPSRFAGAQRSRGIPVASWTVRSPELAQRADRFADAPIAEGAGVR